MGHLTRLFRLQAVGKGAILGAITTEGKPVKSLSTTKQGVWTAVVVKCIKGGV